MSEEAIYCWKCGGFVSGFFAGTPTRCCCRESLNRERLDRIATLERELASLTAERDKLRGELAEAKTEVAIERSKYAAAMRNRGEIIMERDALTQRLKAWRECAVELSEVAKRVQTHGMKSCESECERTLMNEHQHAAQCFVHRALAAFERLQKEEPKP